MKKFNRENEPVAFRQSHKIKLHNKIRNDAYSWMKYIPAKDTRTMDGLPGQIYEHLMAESLYAEKQLESIDDLKGHFINSFMTKELTVTKPPTVIDKEWSYYSELSKNSLVNKFYRKNSAGIVQLLFDESLRAKSSNYYRATDHQASLDDRYFVWAEDLIGNDRHQICVLDIGASIIRTIVKSDAYGYGGFVVSPSSRYLFWIWRDKFNRPSRLYRTDIDGQNTELVYEEKDPALFMKIKRSEKDSFIIFTLYGPITSEAYLIHKDHEVEMPQLLWPRIEGIRYEVFEWENGLIKLTNENNAVNNKVLYTDYDGELKEELVAHDPNIHIISVYPFERALLRLIRFNCKLGLIISDLNGQEIPVNFQNNIYNIEVLPNQSYYAESVRIKYQSPITPPCWFDIDMTTGQAVEAGRCFVKDLDTKKYKVERIYALAKDGNTIPITLITKNQPSGIKSKPLLLTGYGSYGFASEANFSLTALSLVDAGFNYAIAHVRGGSEKGISWYKAACKDGKYKSLTDFIDCAHHLVNIGIAAHGKIVSYGVSAGGLLVCGAMNLEPDLWAGVMARVPFVDMLNTMCDENHPLVPLLRPDWGDPLSDKKAYDYILGVSPYENIKKDHYPPLLCTAGLKDDRVPYWEPAKLVASMRHHNLSENPAILVLNPDSGHQESDNKQTEYEQMAMFWSFVIVRPTHLVIAL